MSCTFCKIIRGELPCRKIYEDASTLAFLDIAGDVDGHILVVPKRHVQSLWDGDTETLDAVMHTVKELSGHLVTDCGYEGVNLLHASGASAGQSVPHLHLHLLPRKTGDGIDAWPQLPGATCDVQELYEKLKMQS